MPRRNEIDAPVATPAQLVMFDPNSTGDDSKQHHAYEYQSTSHEIDCVTLPNVESNLSLRLEVWSTME